MYGSMAILPALHSLRVAAYGFLLLLLFLVPVNEIATFLLTAVLFFY